MHECGIVHLSAADIVHVHAVTEIYFDPRTGPRKSKSKSFTSGERSNASVSYICIMPLIRVRMTIRTLYRQYGTTNSAATHSNEFPASAPASAIISSERV